MSDLHPTNEEDGASAQPGSPTTLLDPALRERIAAWQAEDPDPETAAELAALLSQADSGDAAAIDDLRSRFTGRLGFGTAGLRGELGAGPQRMNRVVVVQAAAGIARHLLGAAPGPQRIVIGYDGRKNSRIFAEDSARVFRGAGFAVSLMPRMLPTPVLAFAVRALDAAAGVMVTASHNPPRDNGYKVYLGGADQGSQLVSPADAAIATLIEQAAAAPLAEIALGEGWDEVPETLIEDYIARTAAIAAPLGEAAGAELDWVYTAMHGVGSETFHRVLDAAGIPAPTVVAEQIEPDGTFPTVDFPNPEEPGALDLAFRTAAAHGAELIVAHDPDADRLAVALRRPAEAGSAPGPFRYERLSGNELGALLGWEMAARAQADGLRGALAASLVSSPALGAVAAHYGLGYRETLTGFKWISRVPELLFGFEEALGYLVNPDDVRDKDGLSAGIAFLSLVQRLHAEGRTIEQHREDFAQTFGVFVSGQVSLRFDELQEIADRMGRLAGSPPREWAGIPVVSVDDFRHGVEDFPPSDILRFRLADGSRIIARPSGTEPKLKVYLDVAATEGATTAEKQAAAASTLAALDAAVRAVLQG